MKDYKIEKGIKRKGRSKYNFDEMEPGDSFKYTGNRNAAIIAFGYYAIRDLYETEKDGDGWRFRLKKKPPWIRKKSKEE